MVTLSQCEYKRGYHAGGMSQPISELITLWIRYPSIIISITCCQVHIQNFFLLGVYMRNYLIFQSIWIITIYLCDYRRDDIGLVNYGNGRYFQGFC